MTDNGYKITTGQTATGSFYSRVDRDGRARTYSDAEVEAALALISAQSELTGSDGTYIWPNDPRAKKIMTAQEATHASRRTLADVLKSKKKPQKPKVDRYGWPIKADTEKKPKKPAWKPTMQPEAERSTGFILPSVVVGGFSAHLNSPERWDVSVYKSASLSNNFLGFDLPPILPIKEHLAKLQKELLGLPEDEELEESQECVWNQYSAANSVLSEQRARGVSYSISCKARMNSLGFNRLKEMMRIQPDGTQMDPETAEIELLGIAWAGALTGPSSAEQFEIHLPPHVLEEDGDPAAGARAMILRHDGSPIELVTKSSSSPPSYADIEPDVIRYDLLSLTAPTEGVANPNIFMTFDLDFLTINGSKWGLAITRHT